MIDIFQMVLDLLNKYFIAGILGCLLYIVYKIVPASLTKWLIREQSYYFVLKNLSTWNNSLSDSLSCFQEPGSRYREGPNTTSFKENRIKGEAAYLNIRGHLSVSRVFLLDNAKKAFEELLSS